jgi:hypothetical protein
MGKGLLSYASSFRLKTGILNLIEDILGVSFSSVGHLTL